MNQIALPRPMPNNYMITMIVIYGEDKKEIFSRGFDDSGKAYQWLMKWLEVHPRHSFEFFLDWDKYTEYRRNERFWDKVLR